MSKYSVSISSKHKSSLDLTCQTFNNHHQPSTSGEFCQATGSQPRLLEGLLARNPHRWVATLASTCTALSSRSLQAGKATPSRPSFQQHQQMMCWCICHQQKVVGRILVVTLLIDAVQQMNVAQRLLYSVWGLRRRATSFWKETSPMLPEQLFMALMPSQSDLAGDLGES